jgi:mRNA-degrading endonuclease RelE of RelBE toxin-antitoxin system
MYRIQFTKQFKKDFNSLTLNEQKAVKNKVAILAENHSPRAVILERSEESSTGYSLPHYKPVNEQTHTSF